MMQSHVSFVATIANLLQKNGHDVVVLDSVLRSDIGNGLEIVEVVQVETSPTVASLVSSKNIPSTFWLLKNTPEFQRETMQKVGQLYLEQCKYLVLNTSTINDLAKMKKFDFGMHEVFDTCGIGIFHTLKIQKSVILSSAGMRDIVSEVLGIAGPLEDASILSDYGNSIPLHQTRRNLMFHSAWRNFFEVQSKPLEALLGCDDSFENILHNTNILLTNSHELTDARRRWSRRVFDIGGVGLKTPKPLNEEYTSLLSQSSKFSSIVLISFGTTAPSYLMPSEYKKSLLKAFSEFPNVALVFFLILSVIDSGKISLFITHCGQNSMLEGFQARVRMLGVPLFGDQHRNAKIAEEASLVNTLAKEDLGDSKKIAEAIRIELQKDERIEANMARVSCSLQNARKNAETTILFAIESVFSCQDPPNFKYSGGRKFSNADQLLLILDMMLCVLVFFLSLLSWWIFCRIRHL